MADREITAVVVEVGAGPINVCELTEFLRLFRAIYIAGLAATGGIVGNYPLPSIRNLADAQTFADQIRGFLVNLSEQDVETFAALRIPEWAEDLRIMTISRNSPLRITFTGIAIALAAAVILSGGTYKFGPMSAELPPLGTGIAALRQALNLEEQKDPHSRAHREPEKRK